MYTSALCRRFSGPRGRLDLLASLLFLSLALFAYSKTAADPDLWGHVRFGQDIIANGGVVRQDPYSYLSGPDEWINHEWLGESVFALVYNALGAPGLVALKLLVALTVVTGVYWRLLRSTDWVLGPVGIGALVVVAMAGAFSTVRPQLFTMLLFTALLFALTFYEGGRRWVLLLAIPILALWVNCHGGVLAGAAALVVWCLARLASRRLRRGALLSRWSRDETLEVGVTISALAATLANPYGLRLPLFLWRTATVARPEISEWQPVTIVSAVGVLYLLLLMLSVIALLRTARRPSWSLLAVWAGITAIAPTAIRHIGLYGIATAVIIGPSQNELLRSWFRAHIERPERRIAAGSRSHAGFQGVMAAGILALLAFAARSGAQIRMTFLDYPTQAVALLKANVTEANLLVSFNWGEYAIWHLGPAVKVGMDGRRETVYADETYRAYTDFHMGLPGWDALVDRPDTDLVLMEAKGVVRSLMSLKPGWVQVYADEVSVLYARDGGDLSRRLLEAARSQTAALAIADAFP